VNPNKKRLKRSWSLPESSMVWVMGSAVKAEGL
jgi:hypothetical protein